MSVNVKDSLMYYITFLINAHNFTNFFPLLSVLYNIIVLLEIYSLYIGNKEIGIAFLEAIFTNVNC